MSENKWTQEQLAAITEKGCNLLVAAAAGAGKTAVLVERIIRKITDDKDPLDIDRLLVVTFTNAAATEMRERIGEAIAKALDRSPESGKLQRQLTLLNKASITTIHSFCLEVIKNHFQCIDLDPGFRIADETECTLMKLEVLEDLFEEKYEKVNAEHEVFFQLVEGYGNGRDDQALQDLVLELYEFVQSCPWPELWLQEKTEHFNLKDHLDFGTTEWAKVLKQSLKIELVGLRDQLNEAVRIIRYAEGLGAYLAIFQEDVSNLEQWINRCEGSWEELYRSFNACGFAKLARCGKDADKEKQEQVKSIRDEVKKRIRKIGDELFACSPEDIISDLKALHPMMKGLSELVMEFGKRYAARKREKSLLDFNDLEHFCLEILTKRDEVGNILPSEVALGFRERFEEILIDEYQDSNLVQEVLLGTISRKNSDHPNVFMVGDVKQSIYRFRQAKPELFLEKYNSYSGESGTQNRKIQLFKNFRSRGEVIHGVNFIFKQIMSKDIGELDYNEEEALNPGASFEQSEDPEVMTGGPVELHLLDVNSEDQEQDFIQDEAFEETDNPSEETAIGAEAEEAPDHIRMEAGLVVGRMMELLQPDQEGRSFKVFDKKLKAYRKLEFRDIVILLRSTRNWADTFVEELSKHGIPAYADSGTGYFKTVEVQIILSLLQIIDNPMQDIPLLAVLRSPIAAFTPEELIDIRLADREGFFYEALRKSAACEEKDVSRKAAWFLDRLEQWRKKACFVTTDELIWYLYSETGYYSYVGAMPGGVQRQANLRILFERARQYEETSYKGLFNFNHFINKLKSNQGDMGSAKILGENENVVRIMSIHKSKGLEFPVVFVSGCGKQFNLQDMNRSILLHQDLGFGPEFVDDQRRISYPTMPKQALRYKTRIESLSEEMRILYVALTRAKEKLIITGKVKGLDKVVKKWSRIGGIRGLKLPEYEMLRAKCYLDWIGPALARHRDGGILRGMIGNGIDPDFDAVGLEDASTWTVRVWNKNEIFTGKQSEIQEEQKQDRLFDEPDTQNLEYETENLIRNRLGWKYPYSEYAVLPTKVSVTELKRRFLAEVSEEYAAAPLYVPPLVKKPVFLSEVKGFNAAERGTILHFVMQHLDFEKITTIKEIKGQVEEMVQKEMLTLSQAGEVDINRISKFFGSALGKRLLKAERVFREVPFNIGIPCQEIFPGIARTESMNENECNPEETVLLQGVIDCYFEEEGEIILMDYKTDYVPEEGIEAIREKYRIQVEYYTRALEHLTQKRVMDRYIYLFWNGEVVKYER